MIGLYALSASACSRPSWPRTKELRIITSTVRIYRMDTPPQSAGFCHCTTCQKLSGSSSMPFVPIPTNSLTWTNEPVVMKKSAIGTRLAWFLMRYHSTPERTSLNVPSVDFGTLLTEEVKKFKPTHHIFVVQKAPWMQIQDDLTQYERFRGDSHQIET